jgi:hypothetical protein
MRPIRMILTLGLPLLVAACAHATLVPQIMAVDSPGVVRVEVKRIHGGIVELAVFNTSPAMIVIDRDGVFLQTPSGRLAREPGGLATTHNVPPGGVHGLNVKFALGDLQAGAPVQLEFPNAILVNGSPVPVPPIPLAVN